jgi:hypothetical protein
LNLIGARALTHLFVIDPRNTPKDVQRWLRLSMPSSHFEKWAHCLCSDETKQTRITTGGHRLEKG